MKGKKQQHNETQTSVIVVRLDSLHVTLLNASDTVL